MAFSGLRLSSISPSSSSLFYSWFSVFFQRKQIFFFSLVSLFHFLFSSLSFVYKMHLKAVNKIELCRKHQRTNRNRKKKKKKMNTKKTSYLASNQAYVNGNGKNVLFFCCRLLFFLFYSFVSIRRIFYRKWFFIWCNQMYLICR